MEVQLYVYDLTRGMARTMSASLLGIHLDAVYHTSLVFNGVEYFFGRGIHTMRPPATTHHGRPMEIISMGTTHLPMDTILEYLESLREIYSPESYDLFAHNCNNFTNDFSMFLVGKGIPDHITNLPKRVLDTPIGQMLKSQIDASMREITQAPVLSTGRPSAPAADGLRGSPTDGSASAATSQNATISPQKSSTRGSVIHVKDRSTLETHLKSVSRTAATIFFTSSTCNPCKMAYPMFDRLAEQHPEALFVKVDINSARDIAMQYQIRATPTFVTFSRGTRHGVWSGADPNLLKANVESLIQQTFPAHPHALLKVPTLQHGSLRPVTYAKTPPLDKLTAKLGNAASASEITALKTFVERRSGDSKEATLPDLKSVGNVYQKKVLALPLEVRFAAVDLLRCTLVDARVGGFFAEEQSPQTIPAVIRHVNGLHDCPHNLRLVTLHLACNLFISPLCVKEILRPSSGSNMAPLLNQLINSSVLDASHLTTRAAGASLAFNLAGANYRMRREDAQDGLAESEQVELAASLLEALIKEDNSDVAKALLLALGYLLYYASQDGEIMDLAKALDAKETLSECKVHAVLAKEVASLV